MKHSDPHLKEDPNKPSDTNFIRQAIEEDLKADRYDGRVHTRFPPEPSGYLHIGHAKAICISFGIAEDFGGLYNLRFDDSNPLTEESEYVEGIKRDVRWLGFDWKDREYHASDYFETLYGYAVKLIEKGKAYVCDLTPDETRTYRGTLIEPGKNSPYRDRSVEENLTLFHGMRDGEFPNGSRTLRAKIDMSSPNLNMRDPVMYRILRAHHYRHGDDWCIYPTYDFTHGQSDSIEGVTHSLCDVQFEDHRPLYDWFLESLEIYQPRQIEFARLNLTYTVLGKRKLKILVEEGHVSGWDDPRLPTLSGMRRRGYTPESIRDFCNRIGVSKADNLIEMGQLEYSIRDDLNRRAPRVMAVLNPLRLLSTITQRDRSRCSTLKTIRKTRTPGHGRSHFRGKSISNEKILWRIHHGNSSDWLRDERCGLSMPIISSVNGSLKTKTAKSLRFTAPMIPKHVVVGRKTDAG